MRTPLFNFNAWCYDDSHGGAQCVVLHTRRTIVCGEWVVGLLEGSVQSLGNAGLDLVVGLPILGTHCSS